jgi:hypothetical protein
MLKTMNMEMTGIAIPMVTIRGMIIPPLHSHCAGYNRKREHWYKHYDRFFSPMHPAGFKHTRNGMKFIKSITYSEFFSKP